VTLKMTMEESAASGPAIAGLHLLPDIAFGTSSLANIWSAQVAFHTHGRGYEYCDAQPGGR
jgi:hypothetical protein